MKKRIKGEARGIEMGAGTKKIPAAGRDHKPPVLKKAWVCFFAVFLALVIISETASAGSGAHGSRTNGEVSSLHNAVYIKKPDVDDGYEFTASVKLEPLAIGMPRLTVSIKVQLKKLIQEFNLELFPALGARVEFQAG